MKYVDEMSKSLADKPGKNDPRRTPAPKKDQKKFSTNATAVTKFNPLEKQK